MRREERVTVQGPVKGQQPDGMSQGGGGEVLLTFCLFSRVSVPRSTAKWHTTHNTEHKAVCCVPFAVCCASLLVDCAP